MINKNGKTKPIWLTKIVVRKTFGFGFGFKRWPQNIAEFFLVRRRKRRFFNSGEEKG